MDGDAPVGDGEFFENEPPNSDLTVRTEPTEAPTRRDRLAVTWVLFVLVGLAGAAMLVGAFMGDATWGRVERASTLLLTPLLTLLSTAVGWYFGSRSAR